MEQVPSTIAYRHLINHTTATHAHTHIHTLQAFPSDVYNRVVEAVRADESLAGKSDKEIKAAVLPFAKFKSEEAVKVGAADVFYHSAFNLCDAGA